jgi:hypothetical protein
MATESNDSVAKEGVYHSSMGEMTEHPLQLPYTPHASVTDEVNALARRGFLKFDFILVLPMLMMFCEC